MSESIAAISTPGGTGGVAIIRISGEDALKIGSEMFSPSSRVKDFTPNYMYPGKISGDGFTDYGYMVYFRAPKSFTGEDVVELHCHGGVQIARGILKKVLQLGARSAERGEFTRRAFLNGKLTLSSAEGMIDMINAESLALVRAGGMLYSEKISRDVKSVQNDLKDILSEVDVQIDYPEEDEEDIDLNTIEQKLSGLCGRLSALISSYAVGKKIKSGVTVAICGKPNAGKSSLLNALVGYDRAIVSPEAGTTRDAVEGEAEINGVKYTFVDTAGIRERAGEVESMGIERAKKAAESSDIVLSVSDGHGEADIPENCKVVHIFNKCDIYTPDKNYDCAVSAKTGDGIEKLKSLISDMCVGDIASDKAYLIEERHYSALTRAYAAMSEALTSVRQGEIFPLSVDLKEAWSCLGEITGETASEEIINNIFEKFCVGK